MNQDVSYRNFSDSAAENYQRYFVPAIGGPVAGVLLAATDLQAGERVLDVACGTGVVARLAAEHVGSTGAVVGVDVAPDMIEVARKTETPEGAASIEWREADAQSLPFPDGSFDVVTCQMGLMFMEDKEKAVSEMRRVLADGGRIALSTPGTIQPPFVIMDEGLTHHISPDLAGFVRAVFSMDDPQVHEGLLKEAGFRDVRGWTSTATLNLPSPVEFLWQYIELTPLGTFVRQAPKDAQDALERDVVARWEPFTGEDGTLAGAQPMVLATGRA